MDFQSIWGLDGSPLIGNLKPTDSELDLLFKELIPDEGALLDVGLSNADFDEAGVSEDLLTAVELQAADHEWPQPSVRPPSDLSQLAHFNLSHSSSGTFTDPSRHASPVDTPADQPYDASAAAWTPRAVFHLPSRPLPAAPIAPAILPPLPTAVNRKVPSGAATSVRGAAQRRHRQRQKEQFASLQQQLSSKLAEVQQLQQQNKELKLKTEVLEKVVDVCDTEISMIQQHISQMQLSCSSAPTPPSSETSSETPSYPSSTSSQQQYDDQPDTPAPAHSADPHGSQPPMYPPGYSPLEVASRYRQFVQQLVRPLVLVDRPDPEPAAVQKVEQVVYSTGGLCHHVSLLYGWVMSQVISMNMDTLAPEEPPDPEHHAKLYRALNLTAAQKQLLSAFYGIYAAAVGSNLAERRQILGVLESSALSGPSSSSSSATAEGQHQHMNSEAVVDADALADATEQLNANLKQMYCITVHCTFFFFNKVLSVVQIARLCTLAYPYFPDAWVLTRMAGEEAAAARCSAQQQVQQV